MLRTALICSLFPTVALAEAPRVVTDIAPVHSLVAQVMQGVGEPLLLVDPSMSPHFATLRPSQARALQEADLVVMIGDELTPWLTRVTTSLTEVSQLSLLAAAPFKLDSTHDHDHGAHGHEDHEDHDEHAHGEHEHAHGEHEHEDHDEHAEHDEHADHDDHDAHGEEEHAGHDHDDHHDEEANLDPHAWLSLQNAGAWLAVIAEHLSDIDPENASVYAANASAAQLQLDVLDAQMPASVGPEKGFIAFHDAYAYFSQWYELPSLGSLADNEGIAPSAEDVRRARDLIEDGQVACIFTEPQFSAKIVESVSEGLEVKVISLDPLGATLTPGPDLYPALMEKLGASFKDCFS